MAAKHIATYPIFGTNPITGRIWNKRVGTGYLYTTIQIVNTAERLAKDDHPFKIRWRNEECRLAAMKPLPIGDA